MNEIPLRAHHGMCLAYFEGKGYSRGFTAHMQQILDAMGENPTVELVTKADAVCAACPNLNQGLCNTAQLVLDYDTRVLSLCGLEPGTRLPWSEFSRLVSEKILKPEKRETICDSCEWTGICKSREDTPNF